MKQKQFAHKLMKASAYSYSITIPKEMVDKYGWRERQKPNVVDRGRGKIEISDWRKR